MPAATWILIYKQPQDTAATAEALKFFAWSTRNGGKMAGRARLRPDGHERGCRYRKDVVGESRTGRQALFTN